MSDDPYAWIEEIADEEVTVAHYRALCEQIWNNEASERDREFVDTVASEFEVELRQDDSFPETLRDEATFWAGWDLGMRLSFMHVDNDCHDEEVHNHMMAHMIRGARFSAIVAMRMLGDLPDDS